MPLTKLAGWAAVGGVALALYLSPWGEELIALLSPCRIEALLSSAGRAAPALYMLLMATAVVVSPLPSLPLDIAAGAFFGVTLGTVYSVIGALIGAVASFGIARLLGRGWIERFLGGHIHFCRTCSDHLLFRVVLVARLLPILSFDLISYGSGLTHMSLGRFALATGLGMTPLTLAYVSFGSALQISSTVAVPLAAGLVILFFLVPGWIERHDLFSMRKHFQHD